MRVLKRSKQLFLTRIDERRFSEALVRSFPEVAFIDGARWPTATPPLRDSIDTASAREVYIWNREIAPAIAPMEWGGGYQGPTSGFVIMLQRSEVKDHLLLSGAIGWGSSTDSEYEPSMSQFVAQVWRILGSVTSRRLVWVNPADRSIIDADVAGFAVGLDAIEWCRQNADRRLKYSTTYNYYLPGELVNTAI